MPWVHIVIALALIQYLGFGYMVGRARARYGIHAPATTGNEVFERYYRVHMNTLEQLIPLIPAIVLFGRYINPLVAAGLGVVYLIGRLLYFTSYVKDPAKREPGFILSALPMAILLGGGLYGACRAALSLYG